MLCIYAIIVLSDTVGGGGRVAAPGLRYPHDYYWLEKLGVYHADKRIFNLAIPEDRFEFNRICENACRSAAHKFHFPVPRILSPADVDLLNLPLSVEEPVMESGFDEPAPAGTVPPPIDEPPPSRSPEAMASHQARREANRLGVELANCVATGTGGIITKDDVLRAWHAADGINAVPRIAETGTVSMSELMGAN